MPTTRYLIIGAGIAGTTTAEEIRKIDADASIVLLSEEYHRLYSRVLLPHYVKGKIDRERVFLKKSTWYAEKNIEVKFGVRAVELNAKNKFVATDEGREYEYDKLLIATGGKVRNLEHEERHYSHLQTLDDADHLVQLLGELRINNEKLIKASILGSGFIALEYVNIFSDRKISANLYMRGDRFFSKSLSQDASDLIQERAEMDGVVVHKNTGDTGTCGSAEPASGKEGTLGNWYRRSGKDKILGIGVGIEPDFSWMKNSGLETRAGIIANEFLETNLKDIYTAGDIAEFDDVYAGRQRTVGNWMNAQTQARTVAKTMTGTRTKFALVSSYTTNCRGLEIIFIGDVDRSLAEKIETRGSKEEGGISELFYRNNHLVGATLVGRNQDRKEITEKIKQNSQKV